MRHPRKKYHQSGFSLIELMIGITIGMFVVAGMAVLFANTSGSREELEKSSRMIENGRYAMELLRDDIQSAGYYDLTGRYVATAYNRVDPCDTSTLGFATSPAIVVPAPLFGFNNSWVTGGCTTSFTSANVSYRAGTDVLVIRRVSTAAPVATSALAPSSTPYLQTSACASDAAATPFKVAVGNSSAFTLRNKNCTGPRPVRALVSRVYFVATCHVCTGPSADQIPTLKMLDLQNGAMTTMDLVEGVENLQIEYRLDTNNDGVIDQFGIKADSIVDDCEAGPPTPPVKGLCWSNVMAVDVYLLARNTEASAGYQDTRSYTLGSAAGDVAGIATAEQAFKRHAFTMTVRASNNAIQRESAP